MGLCCTRGGAGWILGNISSQNGWWGSGTAARGVFGTVGMWPHSRQGGMGVEVPKDLNGLPCLKTAWCSACLRAERVVLLNLCALCLFGC